MKRLRISREKNYEMLSTIIDYVIYFFRDIKISFSMPMDSLPLNSGEYSSTAMLIVSRYFTADLNRNDPSCKDNDSPSNTRCRSFLKGLVTKSGTIIKYC